MLALYRPLAKQQAAVAVSIDRELRAKLPQLPNPLVASWDERARLVLDKGEPWIVLPLELDPYLTKGGGYPFPPQVADQLRRISAGGARFHRIAIAHEVARTGPAAALLPKVTGAGLPITTKDVKECLGRAPAAGQPRALAAGMDKAVKTVLRGVAKGSAMAAQGAAAVLAAPLLDPIVFGVVGLQGNPRSGEPAIYYPLAAWIW